jgi:REase_DpnII-MboI
MQPNEMIATLESYKDELERILSRFKKAHDRIYIDPKDDARFREMALKLSDLFDDEFADGRRHSQLLRTYFNDSISNFAGSPSFRGVENVKGVGAAALARVQRNPLALKKAALEAKARGKKDPDAIVTLAEHLHSVVRQLRERREDRPTLDVKDEYDVQDLLHALLTIHFDDIRKEEWTPSYAGRASRMDFLLREIESVMEIKMTRPNLSTKQLGEQLIVDIAKYRKHPACRTLFCVVYDPEGRISNPRGGGRERPHRGQ